ncbi:hypothetical protein B9Z55_027665 [Caenorhabditis nigoni]|uniref:Uncharacterized protein n=1 Tax=Caenorhabditis nigoni TaxID=1611254 RepID=A0A2G5SF24_9PELO|nr:hypothetical protein B9Z55_027665 [Caenorhabditis nigoni]
MFICEFFRYQYPGLPSLPKAKMQSESTRHQHKSDRRLWIPTSKSPSVRANLDANEANQSSSSDGDDFLQSRQFDRRRREPSELSSARRPRPPNPMRENGEEEESSEM